MSRSRRTASALGALLVALLAGCDDTHPTGPPRTAPLVFVSVLYQSPVIAGLPSVLRAGAYVGPNLCWQIDSVRVEVRGEELRLVGTAVTRAASGACATALSYDSVDVAIPPLRAGTYILRADSLTDTLAVAATGSQVTQRFAAEGLLLAPSRTAPCATFTPDVLHRLRGAVIGGPPVLFAPVRLYGDLAGTIYCERTPRYALQYRRHEPGVAPPWERQ
jgi:hypothetical protein